MLTTTQVFVLLQKRNMLCALYDRELERIALMNQGRFKLDDNTLHYVSLKSIHKVLGKEVNVSWKECESLFDIIARS
jgi:ABC-type hemin transport system ATPase subunit